MFNFRIVIPGAVLIVELRVQTENIDRGHFKHRPSLPYNILTLLSVSL